MATKLKCTNHSIFGARAGNFSIDICTQKARLTELMRRNAETAANS